MRNTSPATFPPLADLERRLAQELAIPARAVIPAACSLLGLKTSAYYRIRGAGAAPTRTIEILLGLLVGGLEDVQLADLLTAIKAHDALQQGEEK